MTDKITDSKTGNVEQPRAVSFPLGLGIFFMPYIFSWFTLRKGYTTKAKVISFGWLFVLLLPIMFGGNKSGKGSNSTDLKKVAEGASAASAAEENVPETILKESCLKVTRYFDAQSKLSDLQKEQLWKDEYRNKVFEWSLEVVEVSSGVFSGFTVQFKCVGSSSFIQDVQLSYPKEAKNLVMQMIKGSAYKVRGRLKTQSTLLGLGGDAIVQ